ncbi:MAG: ATP-binding protein [Anaerolineae bacterium]
MSEILNSLVNNLVLLLAAMYIFSLVSIRLKLTGRTAQIVNGILFGCFGILCMSRPFRIVEGVQLDGKGVTVAVSGAEYGWIGAIVSAIIVTVYRLYQGGAGVTAGLFSIWVNALIGYVVHRWIRRRTQPMNLYTLSVVYALLGLASTLASVIAFHFLPTAARDAMLNTATIPALILYPLTSVMLALSLYDQDQNRRTRESLGSERALLRTLIDNVPDYIFAKDRDLRFIATNTAHAEAAHAVNTDALIGKTARDFWPPELAAQYEQDDRAILGGKVVINEERQSLSKDGKPISVATTKVPVRDKRGNIIGVIGISRDISAQKVKEMQERELEVSRQHTNLLQSFIQNISHDFRTPLSLISTNVFLAQREADSDQRESRLNKIEDQVNHLTKLLNDIEEIIRLDTDQVAMQLMPEHIGELVQNAARACETLASEHDQSLIIDIDNSPLETLADAHYLQSAIRQLIVNAITFSPNHGTVSIKVYREPSNIVIRIQDTGQGIAEQDQPHIFKRMYRGDKARSISTGGSGLGLPIVQKIVEGHQGVIMFQSKIAQGSTFDIRLPAPSVS